MDGDECEEELVTRYRIQDMPTAKDLLDSYSLLIDHQQRVAKWAQLWHHAFDIMSKPRSCWAQAETEYMQRMQNFAAACQKQVLRSGSHLGATFDRHHELTLVYAKELAAPAKDVEAQARGLKRAAAHLIKENFSDEAQYEAARSCHFTLATRKRPKQAVCSGDADAPVYRSLVQATTVAPGDKPKAKPKLKPPGTNDVVLQRLMKQYPLPAEPEPPPPPPRKPQATTKQRLNELEALDGMRILAKGAS